MKKYDEQLSPEALMLHRYLSQYKQCIVRKRTLELRQKEIREEFNHPLKGISYDGMPHGNGVSVGCASLSYQLDEIQTELKDQMQKSIQVLSEIMDILKFLPENSLERCILEHRYIDRYGWVKICRIENISRTPATKYWRKGLYDLLEFKKVQKAVEEFQKIMEP